MSPGWYAIPSTRRDFLNTLSDASFEIFYSYAYHYVRVTADNRAKFWELARFIHFKLMRISESEAHRIVNAAIARAAVSQHPGSRLEGKFTENDVLVILKEQEYNCVACGQGISGRYTIDHIIARSRGGSNHPANIQLLCGPCNSSKLNRSMDEWVAATGRIPAIRVRSGALMTSAKFHATAVCLAEWLYKDHPPGNSYLSYEAATIEFKRYHEPEFEWEFLVYPSLAFGEAYVKTDPTRRVMWQAAMIEGEGRFGWVKPLRRSRREGLRVCSNYRPDDPDLLSFKQAIASASSSASSEPWVLSDELDPALSMFQKRSEALCAPP